MANKKKEAFFTTLYNETVEEAVAIIVKKEQQEFAAFKKRAMKFSWGNFAWAIFMLLFQGFHVWFGVKLLGVPILLQLILFWLF